MRTYRLLKLAGVLLLIGGCSAPPAPQPQGPPPPEFRVTATIKDIMDSVIDPNADYIWDSVATTVSAKGVEEKMPRTDEEWKEVRRHAIALTEGANLLLVPGRHVAKPGEKADDPKVEMSPEEIEAAINQDRATFQKLAHGLQETLAPVLDAIEKKNPEGLLNSGDAIDRACERCHLRYWYPKDETAKRNFEEQEAQAAQAAQAAQPGAKAGEKKDGAAK